MQRRICSVYREPVYDHHPASLENSIGAAPGCISTYHEAGTEHVKMCLYLSLTWDNLNLLDVRDILSHL